MKSKPILFFVTIVIAVLAMMTLVACGDKGGGGSGGGGTPDTPPAEKLKKFDGVKFYYRFGKFPQFIIFLRFHTFLFGGFRNSVIFKRV